MMRFLSERFHSCGDTLIPGYHGQIELLFIVAVKYKKNAKNRRIKDLIPYSPLLLWIAPPIEITTES